VVRRSDGEFVLADIPGLIEGAHEGAGIGDRFLGHIERCGVLVHLVDGTLDDVADAYQTIRTELDAYDQSLGEKPEIVALNKCDALSAQEISEKSKALSEISGAEVHAISAVAGDGMDAIVYRLMKDVRAWRDAELEHEGPLQPAVAGWSP
jgi:GTP-binding protein